MAVVVGAAIGDRRGGDTYGTVQATQAHGCTPPT